MSPEASKLKVFISYSRKDSDFAESLLEVLRTYGFAPFLDKHDIAPGEPWEERLSRLILAADAVVFVLSSDSVCSERCSWEIEETERRGKRLIPVVWRPVEEESTPERLRRLNYIFLDKPQAFGNGLSKLINALNTDIDWVRTHSRLLEEAARWDALGRPGDRLLRESALAEAKAWLSKRSDGTPTPLHLAFIAESESAEAARWREQQQQLEAMAAAQKQREEALAAAERAQKAREEAQRQSEVERKARRRSQLKWRLVVAALAIIFLGGLGWLQTQSEIQAARTSVAEKAAIDGIGLAQQLVTQLKGAGKVPVEVLAETVRLADQGVDALVQPVEKSPVVARHRTELQFAFADISRSRGDAADNDARKKKGGDIIAAAVSLAPTIDSELLRVRLLAIKKTDPRAQAVSHETISAITTALRERHAKDRSSKPTRLALAYALELDIRTLINKDPTPASYEIAFGKMEECAALFRQGADAAAQLSAEELMQFAQCRSRQRELQQLLKRQLDDAAHFDELIQVFNTSLAGRVPAPELAEYFADLYLERSGVNRKQMLFDAQAKDQAEAARIFEEASKRDPSNAQIRLRLAGALYDRAWIIQDRVSRDKLAGNDKQKLMDEKESLLARAVDEMQIVHRANRDNAGWATLYRDYMTDLMRHYQSDNKEERILRFAGDLRRVSKLLAEKATREESRIDSKALYVDALRNVGRAAVAAKCGYRALDYLSRCIGEANRLEPKATVPAVVRFVRSICQDILGTITRDMLGDRDRATCRRPSDIDADEDQQEERQVDRQAARQSALRRIVEHLEAANRETPRMIFVPVRLACARHQLGMARIYEAGEVQQGLDLVKSAAEDGCDDAMKQLAHWSTTGRGPLPQDAKVASAWTERRAQGSGLRSFQVPGQYPWWSSKGQLAVYYLDSRLDRQAMENELWRLQSYLEARLDDDAKAQIAQVFEGKRARKGGNPGNEPSPELTLHYLQDYVAALRRKDDAAAREAYKHLRSVFSLQAKDGKSGQSGDSAAREDDDELKRTFEELRELRPDSDFAARTGRMEIVKLVDELGSTASADDKLWLLDIAWQGVEDPKTAAEIRYMRSSLLKRKGKKSEADAELLSAIALDPEHAFALNSLGYRWADEEQNLPLAVNLLERARKNNPRSPYIADSLGWAYVRAGEIKSGIELLTEARVAMEKMRDASRWAPLDETYYHLGEAYRRLGRASDAKQFLDKALETKPNEEMSRRIKTSLKQLTQ